MDNSLITTAVCKVLEELAQNFRQGQVIDVHTLFDTKQQHFQLLQMGWVEERFIFSCLVHIEVKQSQIWIQHNRTDIELKPLLVAAGISAQNIRIGFVPDYLQNLTS